MSNFRYQHLLGNTICKYLLLFSWLPLCFADGVLCCVVTFWFAAARLMAFLCPVPLESNPPSIAKTAVQEVRTCVLLGLLGFQILCSDP